MARKILDEQPVSLPQVEAMLKERKKDSELIYEQKKTMQYAKEFAKLNEKKAEELIAELETAKIEKRVAVKVTDVLPKNKSELRILFEKHHSPTEAEIKTVLETVKKYGKD